MAEALLAARGTLFEQWQKLEKRLRSLAREDARVRRLMTAPGVGAIVALTYASAIDDPARFRSSKAVGAHFGLTPKKYQSGETDVTGRISKIGDGGVRTALYEAANVILTRPVKGSTLKSWGCAWPLAPACARPRSRSPASSPSFCTECWPTGRASSPTKRRRPQPANERRLQVRAGPDISRPEQGPVAGTMDQVRPMSSQQGVATARC